MQQERICIPSITHLTWVGSERAASPDLVAAGVCIAARAAGCRRSAAARACKGLATGLIACPTPLGLSKLKVLLVLLLRADCCK